MQKLQFANCHVFQASMQQIIWTYRNWHGVQILRHLDFAEQHEKRIRELKELLPAIELENWKYPSVDELLGLTSSWRNGSWRRKDDTRGDSRPTSRRLRKAQFVGQSDWAAIGGGLQADIQGSEGTIFNHLVQEVQSICPHRSRSDCVLPRKRFAPHGKKEPCAISDDDARPRSSARLHCDSVVRWDMVRSRAEEAQRPRVVSFTIVSGLLWCIIYFCLRLTCCLSINVLQQNIQVGWCYLRSEPLKRHSRPPLHCGPKCWEKPKMHSHQIWTLYVFPFSRYCGSTSVAILPVLWQKINFCENWLEFTWNSGSTLLNFKILALLCFDNNTAENIDCKLQNKQRWAAQVIKVAPQVF